ncbi:hypothetical protein AB0K00_35600 [Dactylosporangium sp. NPDC049525]|uniref:hypothetical protein n=1 Tax=Dactylosporangium sp. NPDC049525 TaxID=3154730 RepID=UPI003437C10F
MTHADTDTLIRRLIGGDATATASIVAQARTSQEPILLVAAALIDPTATDLLPRATLLAQSTRDRQLVAIAAAHLDGDHDRVDALARDHLVDHPDNFLVAWIAAAPAATPPAFAPHDPKEK